MPHPLDPVAETFAATIIAAIQQEYPNDLRHRMDHADDRPVPREVHPAFYGCYDWHSAVEMHWALARLARHCPDLVPSAALDVLDAHLSADSLAIEAAYFETRPNFSRPYGWGWVFTLAADTAEWSDPQAQRWTANLAPLTSALSAGLQRWLANADHPLRNGAHTNSAFALARTWRWSQRDPALQAAIVDAATRWFADDHDYPARWEPSGADFLSPTLTEIELMSMVLDPPEFERWFASFLPEIPDSLLTPVRVTDAGDGQIAHLHGLNLHRAHGLRTLSAMLSGHDALDHAAEAHLRASIDRVSGDDYMVEHWLAAYAVLALTGG
jgi:hypothetical protein